MVRQTQLEKRYREVPGNQSAVAAAEYTMAGAELSGLPGESTKRFSSHVEIV